MCQSLDTAWLHASAPTQAAGLMPRGQRPPYGCRAAVLLVPSLLAVAVPGLLVADAGLVSGLLALLPLPSPPPAS